MPDSVFLLIGAAIAVLAALDVGFGHFRPSPFTVEGRPERLGLREFATGPLPIFFFGVGTAMLPGRTVPGALLLLAALGLGAYGWRARRRPRAGNGGEATKQPR